MPLGHDPRGDPETGFEEVGRFGTEKSAKVEYAKLQ
jgi:hypothetical protein